MFSKDSIIVGFICGVIGTIIGSLIFYAMKFSNRSLLDFFRESWANESLPAVISLGAVFNLLIFYVFVYFNLNKSARGVILATFMYVIVVIAIKFF